MSLEVKLHEYQYFAFCGGRKRSNKKPRRVGELREQSRIFMQLSRPTKVNGCEFKASS